MITMIGGIIGYILDLHNKHEDARRTSTLKYVNQLTQKDLLEHYKKLITLWTDKNWTLLTKASPEDKANVIFNIIDAESARPSLFAMRNFYSEASLALRPRFAIRRYRALFLKTLRWRYIITTGRFLLT
jgi:hypothetical protein